MAKQNNCICQPDKCTCDNRSLWNKICDEFTNKKKNIEHYLKEHDLHSDAPKNPKLEYLEKTCFPLLNDALIESLQQAENKDCLLYPKTNFDPLDFIAEYLWNHNPKYPDRSKTYTNIHDMQWAKSFLEECPRPYFPFHFLWSKDYAALKIQSFFRGCMVRKRPEVQEMRIFWKQLKNEYKSSHSSLSKRFYMD